MNKSKKIVLTLVPLIAAALVGCGDDDPANQVTRSCIDPETNKVVEATVCEQMYQSHGQVYGHSNWYYYYYYNRGIPFRPVVGQTYRPGGTVVAPEGFSFSGSEAVGVSRGGFGSSAGHGSAGE